MKLMWNSRPTECIYPCTNGMESLEAVDKAESNDIQQEDQFKTSRVRSVNISVENDRTILVNKVDNEDENKKIDIDDLPELDKEVIRNIEYAEKGEVVTSEVGE
ncbi:hypothetical protein F8M41_001147 [Gigaspora margarita]|uniref:Uncharacterized protein n=1 Tax=Gigaspora margarita TaxID=4874 RepID=A0A8H3XFJ3_GIGMA|nr:hypothetical protein F8M41_001147 [Gigaspora margarita]